MNIWNKEIILQYKKRKIKKEKRKKKKRKIKKEKRNKKKEK
jgi:hypothetical protein